MGTVAGIAYEAAAVKARDSRLGVEMSAGVSLRHLSGSVFIDPRLEREKAAESSSGVKGVSGCNDLKDAARQSAPKH